MAVLTIKVDVLIVETVIASLNVTVIVVARGTATAPAVGVVEVTLGAVASGRVMAADGKLGEGAIWRQESIIGSVFEGSFRRAGERIVPSIRGRAWVNAEARLIMDPADPFVWGIRQA